MSSTVDVPIRELQSMLAELEKILESIGKGNPGYDDFAEAVVKLRWMLKDVPEEADETAE